MGFNYRLPNINAALGCAQMEAFGYLKSRNLASAYKVFKGSDYLFFEEPQYAKSNYWLNSVVCSKGG